MRTLIVAGILLAFGGRPALAGEGKKFGVFVFGRTAETLDEAAHKAREAQTGDEHKRAQEARKTLGKFLEAKHGKKSEDWPKEAREEFDRAWRAEMNVLLAHHEVKITQKKIDAFAKGLANVLKNVAKKTPVAVVESADQADLTVEVLTHRMQTSFPVVANILYMKVTPVGWREAGTQFAGTSFGEIKSKKEYVGQILGFQNLRGAVTTFHPYSDAEPYWMVEVFQQGATGQFLQTAAEALSAFCSGLSEPAMKTER